MLDQISIIGGGPAGAAAALALARAGGHPVISDGSAFPRHKVCGEFLSPEILPVLEQAGIAEGFLSLGAARITHVELYFRRARRRFRLPEQAYGVSRYAFDSFLLRKAMESGSQLRRERCPHANGTVVAAGGRSAAAMRGRRIFGFKAHFHGPLNDAVELYFFPRGYCGLAPIETGTTNVCGLASEELLRTHHFQVDDMLSALPALKSRLSPLARATKWYTTGPLRFGMTRQENSALAAGDATCFVDPFTGSGILSAVQTGIWGAEAVLRAAEGKSWPDCCRWHRGRCAAFYRRQLATTTIIRRLLSLGWAESLAGVVPGWLLFRLTRPAPLQ